MMIDDDLAAIYADDAIAIGVTRQRNGADPQPFRAIVSAADVEAFQHFAIGLATEIRWPTASATLLEGDTVTDGSTTWRVARDGRRVLDGRESLTYLTEI